MLISVDTRMALPPSGTITFLLAGVERSIPLWEMAPDAAAAAVDRCQELIGSVVMAHHGVRYCTGGEGVLAMFRSASAAVAAALAVQRACAAQQWPEGLAIRPRIGVHTAEVRDAAPEDITTATQRCARLRDVAHGAQTLLSAATVALVAEAPPEESWFADHGLHRLRDLSRPEQLFELCHRDVPHEFPPPRSLDVLPNNLPAQLTSFIGRIDELVEVQKLLDERRLLTLAGAGGCGKTRLAVQSVAELADRWPDGVWWVDLGSVSDPSLVARLTASAVRALVEPVGDPLQALAAQLRGRRLLLCLDTCEHLLDACAELADTLLRACPGVSVLATSREPLGVAGETVWRVPSLIEDEAARLFADRAALVRPGFTAGVDDDAVWAVCGRLDGIPLAIELAAAWVRALSPAQIAAGMHDRFRLLAGGPRVAIARQRTLAASMEWSHDGLDEADRVVFRRLAVFAGGFTLDAAVAVCADDPAGEKDLDVLVAIGRLVDKSLLVADDGGTQARYRLLDTVRQYAADRLREAGETDTVQDRHLDHCLAFAEVAEPELERDQDTWRMRLETEHDNLRAALRWGLAVADPDRGRRLAAALARFWYVHGHTQEGLGFLHRAIELAPDDRSILHASLLSGTGQLATGGGRPAMAADLAERGLGIAVEAGDDRNRARCLMVTAYRRFFTDFAAAQDLSVQAQRYGRAADDPVAVDWGQVLEACSLTNRDRHDEAVTLVEEVLERSLPRGERSCAAFARSVQVWAALFTGDLRRADALGIESVRLAAPLGDYFTVGLTTSNLAWIKGLAGDLDAGRTLLDPVIRAVTAAGTEVELLPWLGLIPAKLHLWGGDLDGAVEWFERAARFAEPMTDNWVVARALPGLAGALRRLGHVERAREHADRAVTLATALGVPHVLAEGLGELAFLAVAVGDPGRAEDLHHQALAVRVEHGLRTFTVDSLDALAGLAAQSGGVDAATRLLAASDAAREAMGYPRPAIDQPDHDTTLARVHAALSDDAFAGAWAAGAALSLDDAVSYATRARGTRRRPSAGWASLTPTELEVTRLVVEGFTNPQIGARLFMSRATVKTHLAHIYAKLDISNRTELATLASTRRRR